MFWQLVSVFDSEPLILEQLLEEPEWAGYLKWFRDFNRHVDSQNRVVLDAILPEKLVVRAMEICRLRFRVHLGHLSKCIDQTEDSISAVDAFHRYGLNALEEVLEYGSFSVPVG